MKLVYQAYGRIDVIEQVFLSVVTLKNHWPSEVPLPNVVVYTDQPQKVLAFFSGWDFVQVVTLTKEIIREWRGQIDFVHRVKLKVLEDATKNLTTPIFYLDGDTYFTKDPNTIFSQIQPGVSVMHILESRLDQAEDPLTRKIAKFCKKYVFQVAGRSVQISPTTEMWNAGVIGVHPNHFSIFQHAVELTDALYPLYRKHVMEQLAVSFVLQEKSTLIPCHKEIIHYWAAKKDFDPLIHKFVNEYATADLALAALPKFPWPSPLKAMSRKSWWRNLLPLSFFGK